MHSNVGKGRKTEQEEGIVSKGMIMVDCRLVHKRHAMCWGETDV